MIDSTTIDCGRILAALDTLEDDFEGHGREFDFCKRVYDAGLEKYEKRLGYTGFSERRRILDAGAGFGQWAIAMSRMNQVVIALELNMKRCRILKRIIDALDIKNVMVINGSIDDLPLKAGAFDAVFSYSVIYQASWKKVVSGFARVMEPGGQVYINVNGIGWPFYNIIFNPNPSKDFSPRWHALKSLLKTFSFGFFYRKGDWVLFPRALKRMLRRNGFSDIRIDGDGRLTVMKSPGHIEPFYRKKVFGLVNVFEVLGIRSND